MMHSGVPGSSFFNAFSTAIVTDIFRLSRFLLSVDIKFLSSLISTPIVVEDSINYANFGFRRSLFVSVSV